MVEMKTLTLAGVKYAIKDEYARDKIDMLNRKNESIEADIDILQGKIQNLTTNSVKTVNGQAGHVVLNAEDVNAVPTYRTVNGKKLENNIVLTAADVGALPADTIEDFATEAYVNEKVADIVDSAPEKLNTLNELAAALNNNDNFANDVLDQIGKKVPNTRKINDKPLTSDIILTAADVKALPANTPIPSIEGLATETYVDNKIANLNVSGAVTSVNGKTGAVTLTAADVKAATSNDITNAINAIDFPVDSVNGKTGAVVLNANDIKAEKIDNNGEVIKMGIQNYTDNEINAVGEYIDSTLNIAFSLFTDLNFLEGRYTKDGSLKSSDNTTKRYHSQLLPVKENTAYYMGYIGTAEVTGAFFDKYENFIAPLLTEDIIQYKPSRDPGDDEYRLANGNTISDPEDYVVLGKFITPKNAYYFSYNLSRDKDYIYRQYVCSKPIFALSNTGNQIIYENDPFYQEKKNKNLCVIGASGVTIDRLKSTYKDMESTAQQYTVGFQEYLMPYYNKVDSYGFWSGSWGKHNDEEGQLSIYTGITESGIDFSQYDEFLLIPSTADIDLGLGDIHTTDISKYFGGINGVINHIISKSPLAKFYVANTVHKGGYFSSLATQNSMEMLNTKITDFCSYHSYQLIDLVSGANLSKNTYKAFTWDGKHLNQEGSRSQGLCILKAIINGSSAKIPDSTPETVDFCLYTKFDFIPGRWNSVQSDSLSTSGAHSQLLRVNPDTDYYTGYIDFEKPKKTFGAFFTKEGKWIKTIEVGTKISPENFSTRPGDVERYKYPYAKITDENKRTDIELEGNPDLNPTYAPIYKFRSPAGAYYFSFNLVKGEEDKYIYRRYISSKPLFSHTDAGNHLVFKDGSPSYEKKKNKKLCIIGDMDVGIDRSYYKDITQYTIGFQEYLARWYSQIDNYGYPYGYDTKTGGSIWRGIILKNIEFSDYDEFLIMPSMHGITSESQIGNSDSPIPTKKEDPNDTYIGCLKGIIQHIQEGKNYLPSTKIYIANVLRKGSSYTTYTSLAKKLNKALETFCTDNSYEFINLQAGVGFTDEKGNPSDALHEKYTRPSNQNLLNQAGNERLGKYLIEALVKGDRVERATLIMEDRIATLEEKIAALEALLSESSS